MREPYVFRHFTKTRNLAMPFYIGVAEVADVNGNTDSSRNLGRKGHHKQCNIVIQNSFPITSPGLWMQRRGLALNY